MKITEIFGANVKFYRKKLGISQEELAEKLDITAKHLSTIETGSTFVSASLLEKLTSNLKVSASTLFYAFDVTLSDDNFLSAIDLIIENEYLKATKSIKMQIRYINSQNK